MPTAAPAPASRMPPGEVTARATGGVKNRSRKLNRATAETLRRRAFWQVKLVLWREVCLPERMGAGQKLEMTAVKTLLMLFGSLALYDAALVASAIWRSTLRSASAP